MTILFIEDDVIERMKMHRTISKFANNHQMVEVGNGEEALNYLRSGSALPNVILLDLNMPRMNGIEFLRILKTDEKFRYLPTVVLTTSANNADLLECFRIGIAGYLLKPLKYEEYAEKIIRFLKYWEVNEFVAG